MSSTPLHGARAGSGPSKAFPTVLQSFHILWLLTESDFWTFVIPDTAFGTCGALAGPVLTTNKTANFIAILMRLPRVLAWNWFNLIVFDLANQRFLESVKEDTLNKPWRPIPAGYISPAEMRVLLLAALPLVLAANFALGAWQETSLLFSLTWMYNDLQGDERNFLLRNLIISVASGLYHSGSLRIACGAEDSIHVFGFYWIAIVSAVIFSTMHIQDLKDAAGDSTRNRQSVPLILGDGVARWTIAISILTWSVVCPFFLRLGLSAFILPTSIGAYTAFRTLWKRGTRADCKSWYIWAGWLISLYMLPLVRKFNVSSTP